MSTLSELGRSTCRQWPHVICRVQETANTYHERVGKEQVPFMSAYDLEEHADSEGLLGVDWTACSQRRMSCWTCRVV